MDSFALQFDHAFFCIFAPLIFNWELIDSLYDVLNLLSQSQCKPLRYLTGGSETQVSVQARWPQNRQK